MIEGGISSSAEKSFTQTREERKYHDSRGLALSKEMPFVKPVATRILSMQNKVEANDTKAGFQTC